MNLRKIISSAAALTLLAAVSGAGPARAAEATGVGTASSSDTLLRVLANEGKLLEIRLLGTDGKSSNDDKNGDPSAEGQLGALKVFSVTNPLSQQVNQSVQAHEVRQPDGSATKSVGTTALCHPAAATPLPAGWIGCGTLDAGQLSATQAGSDVASKVQAGISNFSVLGGLASLPTASTLLGTQGSAASTQSSRVVDAAGITVLDLSSFLNSLGIPLVRLPAATVTALVDALKLQVGTLPAGQTVSSYLTSLQAAIAALNTLPVDGGGLLTGTVSGPVAGLLGSIPVAGPIVAPIVVPVVGDATAAVTTLVTSLNTLVGDLLLKSLQALDGAALLKLQDVQVGVVAKAGATMDATTSTVTGRIGKVLVGGVDLGGVDVLGGSSPVTTLTSAVNSQLGKVLATINAGLGTTLTVKLLDKVSTAGQDGSYNKAVGSITAAEVGIVAPVGLTGFIATLPAVVPVGPAFAPGAGSAAKDVQTLLPTNPLITASPTFPAVAYFATDATNLAFAFVGSALTGAARPAGLMGLGGNIKVASVNSAAEYRVVAATPAAPVTSDSLPATGSSTWQLLAMGLLLISLGYGLRQWFPVAHRRD